MAGAALDTFPGATHHIAVLETRRRAVIPRGQDPLVLRQVERLATTMAISIKYSSRPGRSIEGISWIAALLLNKLSMRLLALSG